MIPLNVLTAALKSPTTCPQSTRAGHIDAAAFGRPFISNPDLVRRIALGADLNPWDRNTFYAQDDKGFTDYPFLP
jgi:N-ethylmaleimide reductase